MASAAEVQSEKYEGETERRNSVARTEKGRWERLWPVIACGAGLFSDGYLNNVRTSPSHYHSTHCDMANSHPSDHRPRQHYAQQNLPGRIYSVLGASQRRQHYFRRYRCRYAFLRLHVRPLLAEMVAFRLHHHHHLVRRAGDGFVRCRRESNGLTCCAGRV
jgi:hypothetical protein